MTATLYNADLPPCQSTHSRLPPPAGTAYSLRPSTGRPVSSRLRIRWSFPHETRFDKLPDAVLNASSICVLRVCVIRTSEGGHQSACPTICCCLTAARGRASSACSSRYCRSHRFLGVCPNARQVNDYIDIGKNERAHIAAQAALPADPDRAAGLLVAPTLFTGVTPSMRIAQEEIFGHVAVPHWKALDDVFDPPS